MSIQVVYAKEQAPEAYRKSIFLVGPSPRATSVPSWRPDMISAFEKAGYDGVVFSPEPRDRNYPRDYQAQTEWEKQHLEMADVILAWVPRSTEMPAFTTNVEFGRYITSGKLIYGRPPESPKNRYLDWMYQDHGLGEPYIDMPSIAAAVVGFLGEGAWRSGGERCIPLKIWNTKIFQNWYASLKKAGNRLDGARVLWNFVIPKANFLLAYIIKVKIWIGAEQRHKENEFVFGRTDISCILPYWLDLESNEVLDTKIVLVKEFRSPVRNEDGFVHELPGGSSFKVGKDPLQVAASELKEETGLDIIPERFRMVQGRQLAATLSSHHAVLFTVSLTDEEIALAEKLAKENKTCGVTEETEKTYVEVKTLGELLLTDSVDWSMLGMVLNGVAKHV